MKTGKSDTADDWERTDLSVMVLRKNWVLVWNKNLTEILIHIIKKTQFHMHLKTEMWKVIFKFLMLKAISKNSSLLIQGEEFFKQDMEAINKVKDWHNDIKMKKLLIIRKLCQECKT